VVYESEPLKEEVEGAWRDVSQRIDPQDALTGYGLEKSGAKCTILYEMLVCRGWGQI